LIGTTLKDKTVQIGDPRTNNISMKCGGHEGNKSQKIGFLNTEYIFTCGFAKNNTRQLKLYDMRNFTESVQNVEIDQQSGVMTPNFDADTGLIFVPGRGEGNIKYYDFSSGTIKVASEYKSSIPQKNVSWFPKKAMNYNKCEIARGAKLTNNSVEYVSFYFPRRNEGYDSSIYPNCLSGEPSITVDEWLSGQNKESIRKPITSLENNFAVVEMTFEKKVTIEETTTNKNDNKEARIQELEKENHDLKTHISTLTSNYQHLTKQLADIEEKKNNLEKEIVELKNEIESLNTKNNA